jgi:serine/threonine protein phosphatase PrpC
MKLSAAALSDVGMRRSANEDSYALAPALGLYLVADGMGGHVAGSSRAGSPPSTRSRRSRRWPIATRR